tara:strand:- start:6714 stop:7343 length:630 start_codon:yes stop_codon:yes gene_type:complete
MSEKIWFKDLPGLITKHNFLEFFPTSDMAYIEQINSIVRFAIYLTLILVLFKNNYKVFYILIIILLITYAMYIVESKKRLNKREKYRINNLAKSKNSGSICRKPSVNNPFMNRNIITDSPTKDYQACDIDNETIKEDIKTKFDNKLYRSVGDIFDNQSSDRQFYTMPNTKLVNDQTEFAEWLYKRPSCKGGDVQACYKNVSEVKLHTTG